ncbi:DUF427 domain-containing protein [Rhodococcus sp. 14C212]|uniref:DUF427 domain-containing protein n=1 Tax=Rhodococcus sp. 14C212 TaxID=2711209 RepID=UPI00197EAFBB|nr:DUF427 domain-containing protein [Rhodococcus sp. 14C212]
MTRRSATRRRPPPSDGYLYEPSERRVRGMWAGHTVVDTVHALLVWPPGRPVPFYLFPRDDVRTDLLAPAPAPGDRNDVARWFDLTDGETRAPAAAFVLDVAGLEEYIGFEWFGHRGPGIEHPGGPGIEHPGGPGIEHWYEEDTEIFVHPRDPYSRVDALPSSRHVQVSIGGTVVADTRHPVLLFETRLPVRYYIPPADVDFSVLEETELHTSCPYKGTARYWSFTGSPRAENVAWSYPDPLPAVAPIAGHVAFYNEAVDLVVDGVPLARPGG